MVATAGTACVAAAGGRPGILRLAGLLVGTGLAAGGTNALNQWWERSEDARMRRTRDRPLPAGRLSPGVALAFGCALAGGGGLLLWATTTGLTALLAAATVVLYVVVYTPLKRISPAATYVGAVPGALPILGGWAAVDGTLAPSAWGLFAVLFLWQLPHFFALEWLAREDYRRAGFRTLAVADPTGARSAVHALAATAALLPASLLPLLDPELGLVYGTGAVLAAVPLASAAWGFLAGSRRRWARRVFSASLLYLPAVLLVTAADALA